MGVAKKCGKQEKSYQTLSWFSDDGYNWSDNFDIGDQNFWLWRVTWHNDKAYSIGYGCTDDNRFLRLYTSTDGKSFDVLVDTLYAEGYPNETAIVFKDDTAFCLLRRDNEPNSALIGTALPPYKKWNWKNLEIRIGGPDMIVLPDGSLLATVRLYETKEWHPAHTSLCRINPLEGKLTEVLRLPSGGDTGYAGMVYYDDLLWVSYYSTHEGKTSIYLARVKVD